MHHPPPRAPRALLLAASIVAVATGTKLSVLRSSFLWSGAELSEDRDKATPVCKAAFSKEEDNYCEELLWQCRDDAPRLVDCFKGMRKMFTFEVEKMGTVCADGWGIETSDSQAMFAKCYSWAAEVCRIRDIRQAGKGQVLQTVEKKERCLLTTMMHLTEWRQGMKECRKMGSLSIQSRGWTFWIDKSAERVKNRCETVFNEHCNFPGTVSNDPHTYSRPNPAYLREWQLDEYQSSQTLTCLQTVKATFADGPQFITAKATRSTKFNAVKFVLLVAGTTLAFTNPAFIGGLVTAVAGKTVLASIPFVVEVLSALALIIVDTIADLAQYKHWRALSVEPYARKAAVYIGGSVSSHLITKVGGASAAATAEAIGSVLLTAVFALKSLYGLIQDVGKTTTNDLYQLDRDPVLRKATLKAVSLVGSTNPDQGDFFLIETENEAMAQELRRLWNMTPGLGGGTEFLETGTVTTNSTTTGRRKEMESSEVSACLAERF